MNTRDIKKKLMTGWMVWKMAEGLPRDKIKQLQRDNTKLQDSITYLQSQSMRNNLFAILNKWPTKDLNIQHIHYEHS